MAKLVLHIGTPKTGTTLLQFTWYQSREQLKQANWIYPQLSEQKHHVRVATAFADDSYVPRGPAADLSDAKNRELERDTFAHALDSRVGKEGWILSSEHFSTALRSTEKIEDLRDFLRNRFDDISVAVCIRRPDHYAASSYSQLIKRLFLEGAPFERMPSADRFVTATQDSPEMVHEWLAAFGPDSIIVLPYLERWKTSPQLFIEHFHERCGIDVPISSLTFSGKSNPALSADATLFIQRTAQSRRRVLNRESDDAAGPFDELVARSFQPFISPSATGNFELRRYLKALQSLTPGPPYRLDAQTQQRLQAQSQPQYRAFVEMLGSGGEWDEWFEQEPPPASHDPQTISEERVIEILEALAQQDSGAAQAGAGRWRNRFSRTGRRADTRIKN